MIKNLSKIIAAVNVRLKKERLRMKHVKRILQNIKNQTKSNIHPDLDKIQHSCCYVAKKQLVGFCSNVARGHVQLL